MASNNKNSELSWKKVELIVNSSRLMRRRATNLLINIYVTCKDNKSHPELEDVLNHCKDIFRIVTGSSPSLENYAVLIEGLKVVTDDHFTGFVPQHNEINQILIDAAAKPEFWKIEGGTSNEVTYSSYICARVWFVCAFGFGPSKNSLLKDIQNKRMLLDSLKRAKSKLEELLQQDDYNFRELEVDKIGIHQIWILSAWNLIVKKMASNGWEEYSSDVNKWEEEHSSDVNEPAVPAERPATYTESEAFINNEELLNKVASEAIIDSQVISMVLRLSAGKYFNQVGPLDLAHKKRVSEYIQIVLNNENHGRWQSVIDMEFNIFLNSVNPLVQILDLDLRIIKEFTPKLTDVAIDALQHMEFILKRDGDRTDELFLNDKPVEFNKKAVKKGILTAARALAISSMCLDKFKELLSNSVLDEYRALEVETALGMSDIPDSLGFSPNIEKELIEPWIDSKHSRAGAIMVFGPPGTGKTTIAKIIAKELNGSKQSGYSKHQSDTPWKLLSLSPADFARAGTDGIVRQAEKIFSNLKKVRRCIVLLDEMEEFLQIRSPTSDKSSRLVTTAFLPLLQEAVESKEIILIVATNFVGSIDPAVTRPGRFDFLLPLGPPSETTRTVKINEYLIFADFEHCLKQIFSHHNDINLEPQFDIVKKYLVTYSMGYSHGELIKYIDILKKDTRALAAEIERYENDVAENSLSNEEFTKVFSTSIRIWMWKHRCMNVPIALSGRPGCNWQVFKDEVSRFSRPTVEEADREGDDYWSEPRLPNSM